MGARTAGEAPALRNIHYLSTVFSIIKYLPHAIWALVAIAAFAFGFSRAREIADPEVGTSTTVQAGQPFMQRNPQATSEWLAGSGLGAGLAQKIEFARK